MAFFWELIVRLLLCIWRMRVEVLPVARINWRSCYAWNHFSGICLAFFQNEVKYANAQNGSNVRTDQKYPEPIVIPKTDADKILVWLYKRILIHVNCL